MRVPRLLLGVAALLVVSTTAAATPMVMHATVQHRSSEPGVDFSLLHVGPGASGAITHRLNSAPQDFDYLWSELGAAGLEDDTLFLDGVVIGHDGGGTLTVTGTLTVGPGTFPDIPGSWPLGEPTHYIGGDLDWALTGTGADSGTFHFAPTVYSSKAFNGIQRALDGTMSVYLWGSELSSVANPLAIDLVFTAHAPEPSTIVLLAIGAAGLGVAVRRKRKVELEVGS